MSVRMLRPDSKGRVSLGLLTKGISSFAMHQEQDGKIILEPFFEIPANEKWLFDNAAAIDKVKKGLEQAKNGALIDKGSFSSFAEDDIE
jgi:hypothetical protein